MEQPVGIAPSPNLEELFGTLIANSRGTIEDCISDAEVTMIFELDIVAERTDLLPRVRLDELRVGEQIYRITRYADPRREEYNAYYHYHLWVVDGCVVEGERVWIVPHGHATGREILTARACRYFTTAAGFVQLEGWRQAAKALLRTNIASLLIPPSSPQS